ncbi:MAG: CBS domain-containing protein [Myxococcales bacterium]|nr:CBS domain-containing protein [Myxococcales bacterium]
MSDRPPSQSDRPDQPAGAPAAAAEPPAPSAEPPAAPVASTGSGAAETGAAAAASAAPGAETSDPEIRIARLSDPGVELDPDAPKRPAGPPGPPPPRKASSPPAKASSAIEAAFVQANLPQRRWPPETVADIMTRQLIALGENEPLGELDSAMKRFRFRHLPVVGQAGKLVGLITRSDLLRAAVGAMPDGTTLAERPSPTTSAGVIMRRDVLTARLHTPITSAGRVMAHQKIGCLPVILDDNTLVGIVTETDFVTLALELLERK